MGTAESTATAESPNTRDALLVTSLSLTATESGCAAAESAAPDTATGGAESRATVIAGDGSVTGVGAGAGAGRRAQAASANAARSAEAVRFTRAL